MITIEQNENVICATVMGEFTLGDFKAFEQETLYKLKSPGTLNLLFDLRGMLGYTLDVAWEEIKFFKREHSHDFQKIAVITEDQLMVWQVGLSRLFVDADISVFNDTDDALAWVQE